MSNLDEKIRRQTPSCVGDASVWHPEKETCQSCAASEVCVDSLRQQVGRLKQFMPDFSAARKEVDRLLERHHRHRGKYTPTKYEGKENDIVTTSTKLSSENPAIATARMENASGSHQREESGAVMKPANDPNSTRLTPPNASSAGKGDESPSLKGSTTAISKAGRSTADLAASPKYQFLALVPHQVKSRSTPELLRLLTSASFGIASDGERRNYEEIRRFFCVANIELNLRREVAPRFRDMRRPQHKGLSAEEVLLSKDRQVIDLHWLFCRGVRRTADSKEFEDLLKTKEFDFELASRFAAAKWTAEHKAGLLSLKKNEVWELATIQSKQTRDRFRIIMEGRDNSGKVVEMGAKQVRNYLEESVENNPQNEKYIDSWVKLWICKKMIGNSPSVLERFYPLTGESPIDRSNFSRRLAQIDKRINKYRY